MERDRGEPERVDAGAVGREDRAEDGRGCLVAHDHAAVFFAVAVSEDREIEAAGEGVENLVDVLEHERRFGHVRAAHVLGQPGAGGLGVDELIRRLRAVTHRERGAGVKLSGFFAPGD